MKIDNITSSEMITENQVIAEESVLAIDEIETMIEDVQELRKIFLENDLSEDDMEIVNSILNEIEELANSEEFDLIAEAVDRQFRRYGDKFVRQYRCTSGPKSGRMVVSPAKCGIRKDPLRVRIGKKSARMKKGSRVRKTLFTKRKTQSKRLSRMNAILRGDK
jgi:hypothetical protein